MRNDLAELVGMLVLFGWLLTGKVPGAVLNDSTEVMAWPNEARALAAPPDDAASSYAAWPFTSDRPGDPAPKQSSTSEIPWWDPDARPRLARRQSGWVHRGRGRERDWMSLGVPVRHDLRTARWRMTGVRLLTTAMFPRT